MMISGTRSPRATVLKTNQWLTDIDSKRRYRPSGMRHDRPFVLNLLLQAFNHAKHESRTFHGGPVHFTLYKSTRLSLELDPYILNERDINGVSESEAGYHWLFA